MIIIDRHYAHMSVLAYLMELFQCRPYARMELEYTCMPSYCNISELTIIVYSATRGLDRSLGHHEGNLSS